VLRAAGHKGAVKSPTYTLVEEYDISGRIFFHFDLYRVKDPEELEWIGIGDYLEQKSLCFIEWAEQGKGFLPSPDLELTIDTEGETRIVTIDLVNKNWADKIILHWKNNDIVL
jgi:tRNA threonylcarbamoyladenosine biosynthesis protein TsaE